MIEADLENKLKTKIAAVFEAAGITDIQIIGSLDVAEIKSAEEDGRTGCLAVKMQPRSYPSPTVPECTVNAALALTVRADVDYGGHKYLEIMDTLMNQFQKWQQCLDEAHEDFTTPGFEMTGFVLNDGSTAIDRSAVIFQYSHSFTLYGIINNN